MKNKHTLISIFVLAVLIGGVFYFYNPNLKYFAVKSEKSETLKGTILSLKMGMEKREDKRPGIQIEINLKPENGGSNLKIVANGDTLYSKFIVKSDGTYESSQFRIEEMKTGDNIEVLLGEKTSFGRRVTKLIQYVY